MKKYIVTLIEDDLDQAKLMRQIINELDNFECTNIFFDAESYLTTNLINEDILLLDNVLPGISGIEAIKAILTKNNKLPIVINSNNDNIETILLAIYQGAVGYIDKQNFKDNIELVLNSVVNDGAYSTPKIARTIIDILNSGKKLSLEESIVSKAIIEGDSYNLIAMKMNTSTQNISNTVSNIYKKYRIYNKTNIINLLKRW